MMSSGLAWRLQTTGQGTSIEKHYQIELWEMEDPACYFTLCLVSPSRPMSLYV